LRLHQDTPKRSSIETVVSTATYNVRLHILALILLPKKQPKDQEQDFEKRDQDSSLENHNCGKNARNFLCQTLTLDS